MHIGALSSLQLIMDSLIPLAHGIRIPGAHDTLGLIFATN